MNRYLTLPTLALALVAAFAPAPVVAQAVPDLLLPAQASSVASRRDVPARRVRKARINPAALNSATIRLQLFDDLQPTVNRQTLSRPAPDKMIWVGANESGVQVVLAVVRGVVTGTVFADNRTFEIGLEPDGQYSVAEIDPAAYPTDDPDFGGLQFEVLDVPDIFAGDAVTSPTSETLLSDTPVQVDVMIVWTPQAETAAGGRAAMDSLALSAVANANLVYSNSGVNAQLRLVHSTPVSFTESPSNIGGDLSALSGTADGKMDEVHSLRSQYGADVVTLIGSGYAGAGYCGMGYLMSSVTTSFASSAFNVVDRSCAVGNLSYAHEVGHNEGLHHDPANTGSSSPSYPYAYGYQDPSGYFRTVMSYGGATRIAYLSSPTVFYNTRPTGTSNQDNARALTGTIATVAAFKSVGGSGSGSTTPTTCTYAVSTTSLSFSSGGGSKSVSVTAPTGCSWTTTNDTGASWVSLSTSAGSGNGSVTVSTAPNTGSARSTTITIAGKQIAISEAAPKTRGKR